MKSIFESVIARGGYDLGGVLKKIDSYHIQGKLTDEERDALYQKARENAQPKDSVDILVKLAELEERVRKLEEGSNQGETPAESHPAFVEGKWYRTGDKISYNGKNYVCTAPEGTVCVWNPDAYPDYWSVVD